MTAPAPVYKDQDEFKRYTDAIKAFRAMCPQLTMYARAITGKRVSVKPGQASLTDGVTIEIKPPLALAKRQVHVRDLCNTYDERNLSLCEACRTREGIMVAVQHEIAHIAFGSFEQLHHNKVTTPNIMRVINREFGETTREKFNSEVEKMQYDRAKMAKSTIALANALPDKHISFITLMAEDLRINEKSYRARSGLRKAMMAFERDILENGTELPDGSTTTWADAPIDSQILGGILFSIGGNNLNGYLDAEAIEVVNQTERIWKKMPLADDVYESFGLTLKLLVAIRALGYMQYIEPEKDESDDDSGEEEGDSESDNSGSTSESESSGDGESQEGDDGSSSSQAGGDNSSERSGDDSDSSGSSSGDDSEGDQGNGQSKSKRKSATEKELDQVLRQLFGHKRDPHAEAPDESASGSSDQVDAEESNDEADDSLSEETMTKVIGAMWALDRVPRNIAGIKILNRGEGEAYGFDSYSRYRTRETEPTSEAIIGRAVMQARIAFGNNARVEHHRNQRVGKVASNVLGKRAALGDDRLFGRKIVPDKRNYHVLLGVDISYSTANGAIEHLKQAVIALADVCHRVNVEFSIYAHSTEGGGWVSEEGMSALVWKVKTAKDQWNAASRKAVMDLQPVSGNLDGHTLQFYRKELDKVRATDKVLMYFTDGKMPASNYDEEKMVLESEIEQCKRRRYTLLGVGIGTDSPREYGLDTAVVNSSADYFGVVQHLAKVIMRGGK